MWIHYAAFISENQWLNGFATGLALAVSAWDAVPGLIFLSVVALVIAGLKIQKTEISYLAD